MPGLQNPEISKSDDGENAKVQPWAKHWPPSNPGVHVRKSESGGDGASTFQKPPHEGATVMRLDDPKALFE